MRFLINLNQTTRHILASKSSFNLIGSRFASSISNVTSLPIEHCQSTDDSAYDSVVIVANNLENDLAKCKLENNFSDLKNFKQVRVMPINQLRKFQMNLSNNIIN
jgi:hypothetical protein